MEWIIVIVLVFIAVLPRLLLKLSINSVLCREITDKPFICPNFGHKFYARWYQMWFFKRNSVYLCKSAKLKCPKCGITDMCRHDEYA